MLSREIKFKLAEILAKAYKSKRVDKRIKGKKK